MPMQLYSERHKCHDYFSDASAMASSRKRQSSSIPAAMRTNSPVSVSFSSRCRLPTMSFWNRATRVEGSRVDTGGVPGTAEEAGSESVLGWGAEAGEDAREQREDGEDTLAALEAGEDAEDSADRLVLRQRRHR